MILDELKHVFASFVGAGTFIANATNIDDLLSRFGVGVAVGVAVWCITKGISYAIKRVRE